MPRRGPGKEIGCRIEPLPSGRDGCSQGPDSRERGHARPYYRFDAPLFNVAEDDHTLTLTCRACGHIFWYFAHADPIEIQADADDHLLECHPELWEVHRGIEEAPTPSA